MPLAWSRRLNAGFGGCGRGRILSHAVDADIPQTCKRPVVTRERAFFLFSFHCCAHYHLSHPAVALSNVADGEQKKMLSCCRVTASTTNPVMSLSPAPSQPPQSALYLHSCQSVCPSSPRLIREFGGTGPPDVDYLACR